MKWYMSKTEGLVNLDAGRRLSVIRNPKNMALHCIVLDSIDDDTNGIVLYEGEDVDDEYQRIAREIGAI